jgi:hypothetical protein
MIWTDQVVWSRTARMTRTSYHFGDVFVIVAYRQFTDDTVCFAIHTVRHCSPFPAAPATEGF